MVPVVVTMMTMMATSIVDIAVSTADVVLMMLTRLGFGDPEKECFYTPCTWNGLEARAEDPFADALGGIPPGIFGFVDTWPCPASGFSKVFLYLFGFFLGRERAGNVERVLLGLGGECRVLVGFRVAVSLCNRHCSLVCVKLGFMQPRPKSLTQAQCKLPMMLNHLHSGSHEDLKCSVVQTSDLGCLVSSSPKCVVGFLGYS